MVTLTLPTPYGIVFGMTDLELFEQLTTEIRKYTAALAVHRGVGRARMDALQAEMDARLDAIDRGGPVVAPCLLPARDCVVSALVLHQLPDGSRIRDASVARLTAEECADQFEGFIEYYKEKGQWWVHTRDGDIPARTSFWPHEAHRLNCLTVGNPYLMPQVTTSQYDVSSCVECPFFGRADADLPIRYETPVCEHPHNSDCSRKPADPPDTMPDDCHLRTGSILVRSSG